ncbi:MAG: porin [Betaproteobacteria bacterium]|nr:porin [Betaproteobacteria bacterium]
MKKQNSLLGAVVLAACASAASAQSQVTLFGIVDVAATNIKNGSAGSLKSLSSGQASTSRLGFRGVEDLGGGLKAGFWLEGQLDMDDGGSSFNFQRRSTVSLTGSLGELRIGRDQVPSYLNWGNYDLWAYVGVATTANLRGSFLSLGGASTGVRASNTIGYWTPVVGGYSGHFMVAAGEGGIGNKYAGARVGYESKTLEVSGAVSKTYKTGAMLDELTTQSIGASYDFGPVYVVAAYEKAEYSTLDRELVTIGVRVPVGQGRIKAQYAKSSGTGPTARPKQYDATLIGVGYDYRLSRRTSLYVNYGRIDNDGTTVTGGTFTTTGNGPSGIRRGETSSGYQFGVRHSF